MTPNEQALIAEIFDYFPGTQEVAWYPSSGAASEPASADGNVPAAPVILQDELF